MKGKSAGQSYKIDPANSKETLQVWNGKAHTTILYNEQAKPNTRAHNQLNGLETNWTMCSKWNDANSSRQ